VSAAGAVRRGVVVPLILAVQTGVILTSPIFFVGAAILSVVQRSSRPWRSVALVVAFAVIELRTVGRLLRGVDDVDELVEEVLDAGYRAMRRILAVPLVIEAGSPLPSDLATSDGLVVLARHCGPGDSLYIAWLLAVHYKLSLRVVLKEALQIEPAINVAGEALPFCFVGNDADATKQSVTELAETLSTGTALLLFPEGGNFSWARWREGIRYLSSHGEQRAARRALSRTHTLTPRPGGTLAALSAAPRADVLLVAHSGFSDDGRDRPWWRIPVGRDFLVRAMLFPAAIVPRDEAGALTFLDSAWTRIDTWVEAFADLNEPTDVA
jgi:1-acyl-sn-glycerol-3-phosphate acyltransferase